MEKKEGTPVHHPKHYNSHPSGVECIEIFRFLPPNIAAAFKYIWRYKHKGKPIEDLEKAVWYIEDFIENALPQTDDNLFESREPFLRTKIEKVVAHENEKITLIMEALVLKWYAKVYLDGAILCIKNLIKEELNANPL